MLSIPFFSLLFYYYCYPLICQMWALQLLTSKISFQCDIHLILTSLSKHMVRKHSYNFRYLTNLLKIRSHGFDRAQYCNVNQI